ncbi:COX8 domain-containing protein [Periophthalmus magnuspinnatus]|uniref:COX8 domain-containing protein n=1 Tax=Periophthalmus magnuspinnatus TaxID=409849 RepID=UPI002436BC7B|nr:COX8 domain-containing protein [Periophthalmus magnuspinnatus]
MLSVLTRPTMRTILCCHRIIYSKAPQEKIGPGKTAFVLFVFSMALLAPAGWIMHHIPEYRQRPTTTTD